MTFYYRALSSSESIYLNLMICWEISLRYVDGRGISENGKQFVAEDFQHARRDWAREDYTT